MLGSKMSENAENIYVSQASYQTFLCRHIVLIHLKHYCNNIGKLLTYFDTFTHKQWDF